MVRPVYNLIEYSNNYSKNDSGWQYYRDDPHDDMEDSESLKFKVNRTGGTPADGNTKEIDIAVPLK